MNQLQIELARKLVAHERWPANTLDRDGEEFRLDGRAGIYQDIPHGFSSWRDLPDLTDDATAGVLLGMWRDAVKANGDDYEGCSSRAYRASCVGLMRAAFWDQEGQTHMAELFARMLLDAWSAQ
jgi:hypothetical protein